MKAESGNGNHQHGVLHRLLPAVLPVLLISIGYIDPGKWVITVEGGARFGLDLVVPMLLFNLAAILCQYLSVRIGVVTGRDLAQICSDEYETFTRIILGFQAEFSVIVLDLTMILGVAHGINLLFGVDLSTGVFLAALDAILFPVFASLLDYCRASFLCMYAAGFVLLSYVLGVLVSQPEISLSMTGMLTRLSGESAFALMTLLGASIMPHNFYLHSSIVQQQQRPSFISTSTLCQDHFFVIVCVFSGLFLVNYVLMNAASNVFYNAGLVLITFQDAMSLLDQAFRNGILAAIFMLVMFLSNQITASTWNLGGKVVLHDLLGLHIPGWLHRVTIRIIASIPALYCVWTSGAEGIYQLLIFTQVMIALLLPSSVIPLFRIASSRPIMGVYKMSPIVEFLALVTFMGMLGLKIVFVVEMIFGNSDWVGSLKLNAGIGMSFPFVVLLITAGASFSLMLWLAATPLKSAGFRNEAHALNWDLDRTVSVPEAATEREENDASETRYHEDEPGCIEERSSIPENSFESHFDLSSPNYDLDLPETILESDQEILLNTVSDNSSKNICPGPMLHSIHESISVTESASAVVNEAADDLPGSKTSKIEEKNSMERIATLEGNLQFEKHDDLGGALEPKEPSKPPSGSISSPTPDGPPSFRSLSGKNDGGGSGTGSLSRLAGLGRAARRQLAAILDEFWGQLYDFHGQHTQEAKMKKLDVLLGVDLKQLKVDITGKEHGGFFTSVGGRASDALINSSPYDSPKQLQVQNSFDSSNGYSRGSSMWSNHMQLLDAYVQNSSHNVDSGERRYSSLRTATSADAWDHQPATVHGYQIKSYLNRIAKDRSSDSSNGQMDLQASNYPALGPTNYRDSVPFTLQQKLQNGVTPTQNPGVQNVAVSRNNPLQSGISYYDIGSPRINDNSGISVNSKKYHSLPSISGLSVPSRDLYMSKNNAQWDSSVGYGSSAAGRPNYETSMYANAGSRAGVPLAFDELFQSEGYRDAFPLQLSSSAGSGSLWSRQPFEQFGVAEIKRTAGSEARGSGLNSTTRHTAFGIDFESKLLLSFRLCIVKLLKLEGSDWLFRQNDGADEDLIDRVAAREKFLYDAETRHINQVHLGEPQYMSPERKYGSTLKNDEANLTNVLISSVPNCGEGCIWKVDLIISFGVWCIHRILDLSLMESRPELWGKYTYVLNRLQGVIDLAFSKPRSPMSPCFCLEIPAEYQQKSSSPVSNGLLPPTAKPGRGKCTNAAILLDIIKDVELAISCRKGRSGTAAGDVAFPKGKENLASVLKRYKRRLSTLVSAHDGPGSRKIPMSAPLSASYGS